MGLVTYNEFLGVEQKGGSIREDLQDYVTNVSPQETPLLAGLAQVKVNAGLVEWLVDQLPPAGPNAAKEGAEFEDSGVTAPTRRAALVQTFYKGGVVSDRERNVLHAGFGDAFDYAEFKAFTALKNDIEHALHRGSAVSGSASTAAQFAGLLNLLSTNFTNLSGTTLTESVFNDILELVYQNGAVNPSEVYCNSRIKRTISGYATKTTFQIPAADRRQILTTDVYDSDFGTLRIFLSRNQLRSATKAGMGNSFVVIDPSYFQTGWLQTVKRERLARDGIRDRFQISAEMTLIARNEAAGGGVYNAVALT